MTTTHDLDAKELSNCLALLVGDNALVKLAPLVQFFQSSFQVSGPAFSASTTTDAAAGTRDLEVGMAGGCSRNLRCKTNQERLS